LIVWIQKHRLISFTTLLLILLTLLILLFFLSLFSVLVILNCIRNHLLLLWCLLDSWPSCLYLLRFVFLLCVIFFLLGLLFNDLILKLIKLFILPLKSSLDV
jgi:hypothetical protein